MLSLLQPFLQDLRCILHPTQLLPTLLLQKKNSFKKCQKIFFIGGLPFILLATAVHLQYSQIMKQQCTTYIIMKLQILCNIFQRLLVPLISFEKKTHHTPLQSNTTVSFCEVYPAFLIKNLALHICPGLCSKPSDKTSRPVFLHGITLHRASL